MLGRTLIEFICESELEDHQLRMDNRKHLISERFERCFIHKDGSVRWIIISASPILVDGVYNGSFAMLTDVTEMKLVELALRDSEERYRLIVESAAEGDYYIR